MMDMMLPREKKTLETKKKIVDAAGKLMRQYDFRYLTVKNVCEEAGVAYGSFYHHFGTKENVIYEYCKGLFEKMLEANPLPENIKNEDYARIVIWYLLVYSKFCELMGKDIIKYVYENCTDDLFFDDHFDTLVRGVIRYAFNHECVNLVDHPERLINVSDDVAVVYKGVVMCWFNDFKLETHRGRLCIGMEHVMHQMLSAFKSQKYIEMTGVEYIMVTDDPEFDKLFNIIPELQS